ncbi:MAG: hypothetical protein HC893_12885 [Chloroflexaceae bacterium]|nr:hypothetical protein [Chloroflexaceae bacterium]
MAAVDRDGNAITQADSILVNLYFSDLLVTDRTYGEREDQPFWGVWLANSTQQFVISDTTQLAELNALDWRPVQVANAARSTADNSYTFTVPNWSLFTGVPNAQVGRDYYVYARVIDGAGNASVQTLVTQRIPVSADAVGPSLFLPRLTR